jgi:hypothetical protein
MSTLRDKDILTPPRREWVGTITGDVLEVLAVHLRGVDGNPTDAVKGDLWYDSTANVLKYKDNTGVKTIATV